MSVLPEVFARVGHAVPAALGDWDDRVAAWLDAYYDSSPEAQVSEIVIDTAVFLFDLIAERVVLAYAVSTEPLTKRDKSRIGGFPNVNRAVQAELGSEAFAVDKGHYLGHASGGQLDINLFPHRSELNRGRSTDGKLFRRMERVVADNPGTFFYHRPLYDDGTWIPADLEYGVLVDSADWWVERFENKPRRPGPPT